MRASRLGGAVVLLGALASAQRTWIVDASGGPGTTHRDIPPAVAVARDGDTILVRKGTYSPFTLRKALTVLGQPGAKVQSGGPSAVTITGIAAGKHVVLEGLEVRGPLGASARKPGILVSSCAGAVHLTGLVLPKVLVRISMPGGITIRSCRQVTIGNVVVSTASPLDVGSASHVAVHGSRFTGSDALPAPFTSIPPTPGVLVQGGSTVTMAQCSATGGRGIFSAPRGTRAAAPAVVVRASSLTLAGDALDTYAAGARPRFVTQKSPAIETSSAFLWVARAIRLVPNAGAPPITGNPRTRVGDPVSLRAQNAPPGGSVRLTTISGRGERVFLLLGLPGPVQSTPWGAFWLDPGTAALLASTTQNTSGHWNVGVPVPPIPPLRGWAIGFQALSGIKGSRTAPLRLSTPAVAVLD